VEHGSVDDERTEQAAQFLAVPYVLLLEAVVGRDGSPIYRASYPECPGCVGEASRPTDAVEQLERDRARLTYDLLAEGVAPPQPRAPIKHLALAEAITPFTPNRRSKPLAEDYTHVS
jgi:hypothetical protein